MTHLQTTAARQAFEDKITDKMESLKRAWEASTNEADRTNFNDLYNELNEQWLYARQSKEWIFNFNGGGWNSVYAADMEIAIQKAKAEYGGTLEVDEKTFRVATPEDLKANSSLFY